jgi:hypothetical protein
MATYSDDEDLVPVYFPTASALPDTLAPLHEEAFAQINRDLVAMEWEAEDLAALTQETLDALVKPSCCYVMHLLTRSAISHGRSDSALEQARFWEGEYRKALAATPIVTTLLEDDDPPATGGGYVVLG